MKLETKLIVALGVLLILAGMAYVYAFGGQLQGRFDSTPTLPPAESNLPR